MSSDVTLINAKGIASHSIVSKDEIQDWLVTFLARQLEVSEAAIDTQASFDSFAIDSATAVGMTGELEEWLGAPVDPTIVYDYPTIEAVSEHLAREG